MPDKQESKQLRDYQQEMLVRLNRAWRKHRSVMVQMPTGTGKTILLTEVIKAGVEVIKASVSGGVLVVAHRRELIEQISRTLAALGIGHGLIISGKEADGTELVQVASIQTLTRRGVADFKPSLVIVDEAHHALAETYRVLWECWPEAKFLGLTATPCRLSGEAFTDLFDVLLQSWSIREFIRKGWLSDLDYVSVRSDSVAMRKVASLNKRGADGDYQTKQMANVLDVPESIEHLYQSYKKYADGKKGIVYAINRTHARHIAEYYQAHGVNCCMIDANTPQEKRRRWVESYRQGKIDVLVNVDIFSNGFDCPEVEFIQLARPTLSLALYLQQIGRGMRISDGKNIVTILDQVGLWLAFGLPTSDWNWKDMFEGKLAGKGRLANNTPGLPRSNGEGKVLVNEEMYRIQALLSEIGGLEKGKSWKSRKERTKTYGPYQLEIFKEGGCYGIKCKGEVCLPAIYQQLEQLAKNDRYFALALLPREQTGGAEKWTVITMEGEDLKAGMAGDYIGQKDGVFQFRTKEEGRMKTSLHDVENHETYVEARMDMIGDLQFFYLYNERIYILRSDPTYRKFFRKDEAVYNKSITIIHRDLFVKTDGNKHYQIEGYHKDCVIVKDNQHLLEIGKDGNTRRILKRMPIGTTEHPDFLMLGLQRETVMSAAISAESNQQLRDYQREMLDKFRNVGRRQKRVLLQIPTGTGKTWMAMPAIQDEIKVHNRLYGYQARKVLIVTHREKLVGQIATELERCNIKPRLMRQGFCAYRERPDVTICTTAFIQGHLGSIDRDYSPTLIIFDEAHRIPKKVYAKLLGRWPNVRSLGLTSTPIGGNGLTLKDIYGQFVPSWNIRRLIGGGWLKDVVYIDEGLDERKKRELASLGGSDEYGDYMTDDVVKVLDTPAEVERLCLSYLKHANGKRGIVCAINKKHAKHIAECYKEHGVKADACMDLNTPEGKQQAENLRNGNLKVLVEVKQFSDGFRCPEIEFIQLACPTRLLATYLHQVGCGMRTGQIPGDRLTVLDYVRAKETFGLPTDDRDWNALFAGNKPENIVKKRTRKIVVKQEEPVKPSPTTAKWQLRMQRLLGDVPV